MKEEAEAAVETAKGVLQDLVVVVSLVRTLTDSFGSASDLYRKLKQKSHTRNNDDEKAQEHKPLHTRRESKASHQLENRYQTGWNDARKDHYSDSDEELICTSSSQVRAEYDRGYRKLGEPFARGDLMTQNQLQSQIIQLQQILLNIHQDLLLSAYISPSSSHSHLIRLIQTTRRARAASIVALNMQYQRMLPPVPKISPEPFIPGAFSLPLRGHREDLHPIRRRRSRRRRGRDDDSSCSDSSSDLDTPNPRPKPKPTLGCRGNSLFCVYARDLQDKPRLPLTDNYKTGGDNICPFCHSHIATRPGKAWEIIVDGDKKFDKHTNILSRTFLVKTRFVVKSHRESGGFACVLCARFKESDTVCGKIEALMEHLWKEHTGEELAQDEDIVEC
ncbi:Nn.00g035970.m01.CDS01 [Neocucurbitaria sp. VM-36]